MALADVDDAVVEASYCCICRRSSDGKWKKHVFTRSHQQRAPEFLQQRIAALDAQLSALPSRGASASSSSPVSTETLEQLTWKCSFCEIREARGWIAGVEHHGSEAHRKQLDAFCRLHRCDVDRTARHKLHLPPIRCLQLRKAFEALQRQEEAQQQHLSTQLQPFDSALSGSATVAAGVRTEAFLSSAAARLQHVYAKSATLAASQPELPSAVESTVPVMAPQAPLGTRIKTVESSLGILQNPLGQHDGKRVWGGGIVKVKKSDWVSWPIDALVKEENNRNSANNDASQGSTDNGGRSLTHRVTELAFGNGLGQIARVSWGDSVANVHTAAVPPWMVQSEEEYKRCNQLGVVSSTSVAQQTAMDQQQEETKKEESKGLTESLVLKPAANYENPNWLPNFGGVWQEGPRSKTKQEFKSTLSSSAILTTQLEPSSVYQRRRRVALVSSGSASPLLPPPPPPPTQPSAPLPSSQPPPPQQQHKTEQEFRSTLSDSAVPITQFKPASVYQRKRRIASSSSNPVPLSQQPAPAQLSSAHPPQQQQQQPSLIPQQLPPQPQEPFASQQQDQKLSLILSTRMDHAQASARDNFPPQPLEVTTNTPMDAKKQLLLAQKERLRAKMAAKKAATR